MTQTAPHPAMPELSRYGLGSAGLGNLYTEVSDSQAHDALETAGKVGLNVLDTSPFYGHGLSEQRIGAFLARSAQRPVLSTKVGRVLQPAGSGRVPDNGFASPAPFIPTFDYSAQGIRASFASSQVRLGVEAVDILLLHDIGKMSHGDAHAGVFSQAVHEAIPEMAAMKREGKTTWIGLGVNEIEVCEQALAQVELDVLLIAGRYTLLEHEPSLPFMDACHERGVKIMIGGAFNSGLLVVSGDEPLHYNYSTAPTWATQRADALREVCSSFETPLPAAALQFCSAHPAVVTVLAGARTGEQVRQVAAWTGLQIDPGLWTALKERSLIAADAPVPT